MLPEGDVDCFRFMIRICDPEYVADDLHNASPSDIRKPIQITHVRTPQCRACATAPSAADSIVDRS